MTEYYDFVPTGGNPKGIQTGYCICKKCGSRVETGIVNLSTHWADCYQEEFKANYTTAAILTSSTPEEFIDKMAELEKITKKDGKN